MLLHSCREHLKEARVHLWGVFSGRAGLLEVRRWIYDVRIYYSYLYIADVVMMS